MFIVDLGFNEYLEFSNLEEATNFCNEVQKTTKEILSIVEKRVIKQLELSLPAT